MDFKTCTKCGKEYPNSNEWFYSKGNNKFHTECKICFGIRKKEYKIHKKLYPDKHKTKDEIIKQQEEKQIQIFTKKLLNLFKLKLNIETKECKQCGELLPRTDEYFINPNSNDKNTCKKCALENRVGTKREGYKVCKKCGIEKPATLEYFRADKCCIYGVKAVCIECRDKQTKEWYENNKEHVLELSKEWRENNIEHINKRLQEYRKTQSYKDRKNKYKNEKRKTDPMCKLNHNFSGRMHKCLSGNKKGMHWEKLVGYNGNQLKEHLEKQFQPGMTWENYGVFGWHVDHIRPVASFNFTNPEDEEFKQCWALENLQPLWWQDNIAKSDKWESA